jgi:acetyl esterase/lipase
MLAAVAFATLLMVGCASTPKPIASCDFVRTNDAVPTEIAAKLRAIGRVSAPDETRPLYAPLQATEPFDRVRITRDLSYGPANAHRLDVFTMDGGAPKPVLVFVHGGAYIGGDKHVADSPFYTNVGVWAARNGMVGVNINYRLAPQAQWPAAQRDIASALAWVRANVAAYGGNPQRIFLMGHSAGASHTASYLGHPEFQGPEATGLAGAIMVSAYYDFESLNAGPTFLQYHGSDKTVYVKRSPLPGLMASRVPMLFAVGEFDTPEFDQQATLLMSRLRAAGRCPDIVKLSAHSHMSEIYSIGTADAGLTDEILKFVRSQR